MNPLPPPTLAAALQHRSSASSATPGLSPPPPTPSQKLRRASSLPLLITLTTTATDNIQAKMLPGSIVTMVPLQSQALASAALPIIQDLARPVRSSARSCRHSQPPTLAHPAVHATPTPPILLWPLRTPCGTSGPPSDPSGPLRTPLGPSGPPPDPSGPFRTPYGTSGPPSDLSKPRTPSRLPVRSGPVRSSARSCRLSQPPTRAHFAVNEANISMEKEAQPWLAAGAASTRVAARSEISRNPATPRPPTLAVHEDAHLPGDFTQSHHAEAAVARDRCRLRQGCGSLGDFTQPRYAEAADARRPRGCQPARRFLAISTFRGRRRSRPVPPPLGLRLARRFHATSSLRGSRRSRPKNLHCRPAPHLPTRTEIAVARSPQGRPSGRRRPARVAARSEIPRNLITPRPPMLAIQAIALPARNRICQHDRHPRIPHATSYPKLS